MYKTLVGKPERNRPIGRPRHRWEVNIRMDLKEIGCENVDWICGLHIAQDRDQWWTFVNTVMNVRVKRGISGLAE
jgi:3-oxoacyl-ACP reductase-like protein